jgi:hypothetical protein
MQSSHLQVPHNDTLPVEIRQAKEAGRLAVFVGAGFPMNFGSWSWDQLAKGFVQKCFELKLFNAREKDNYLGVLREKQTALIDMITFCFKKMTENKLENGILELLSDSCKTDPLLQGKMIEAYSELKRLGDYYLTTNYDLFFDSFFAPEHIFYKKSLFCSLNGNEALESDTLYHIHGSIQELNSVVLTNEHYVERCANQNYKQFLRNILSNYAVLFVGCSVEEYIRNILRENKKSGNTNNNFLLNRYFSDKFDLYSLDVATFADCNIRVVSYVGDKQDYLEQLDIIKSWNNQISGMGLEIK